MKQKVILIVGAVAILATSGAIVVVVGCCSLQPAITLGGLL
jgi:hypothetical protein